MSCDQAIPRPQLAAYWSGDLTEAESEAIEHHVFACDSCASAWRKLAELVESLATRLPPTLSAGAIARLERSGQRLLQTMIEPDARAVVTFNKEVDLLVHRLQVTGLERVERLDCEVIDAASGASIIGFANVHFEPERAEVNLVCQRHYAERFPPDARIKLVSVTADAREVVAEFGVMHVVV